jgi:hypothetical protein
MSAMVMPFGKYKSTPIDEVPRDYLAWTIKEGALRDGPLKNRVVAILAGDPEAPPPIAPPEKVAVVLAALNGVRHTATDLMRSLKNLVEAIDELEGEGARIVRKPSAPLDRKEPPHGPTPESRRRVLPATVPG